MSGMCVGRDYILNRAANGSLTKKLTYEQRPEGRLGKSYILGKIVPA